MLNGKHYYFSLIDFEKAFDSIHRETLWKIMAAYGIPAKLIKVVQALYKNSEICVINNGVQSEWIKIISGVKQGCSMSGFLFILVLDWIMRQCVEDKNTGIRWNFTSKLEDLEFADDIALLSSKFSDMQQKMQKISETSETTGLKINASKTKALRINTRIKDQLMMKNEGIEDVDKFTYPGTLITKEGGTSEEIKIRLHKARAAFNQLKQIWKSNIYSRNTKIKIYNTNVKPVFLYGSECWKINNTEVRKCETLQNRCMKIHWPNTISNENLHRATKTNTVEDEIKAKRWKYIGHILRREKKENIRIALTWAPEGKRSRGRPRETWRRTVERERKEMGWKDWGAAEKMAKERPKWRSLCLALCSTRNEEDR